MEVSDLFEIIVIIYQTIWRHLPEDPYLNNELTPFFMVSLKFYSQEINSIQQ
jgi:hypothetical protein